MLETLKASCRRSMHALARDRRGTIALLVAFLTPVLLGVAGLSVDVGRAYVAKRQLQDATQAAALAGAAALAAPGATTSTVMTQVDAWRSANAPSGLTVSATSTTVSCDSTTSGLPPCNATMPNVVTVSQTASVPTHFLKVLGKTSFGLAATAAAARAGGEGRPLNIMFVFDTTGSMHVVDPTCTIPNRAKPTKIQCALYAVQEVLKVMPTSVDKVGLMIFPGMATQWSPTSHPCREKPAPVSYLTPNIKYQVGTTLDDTYNDGAGALVEASPTVQAVGNYPGMSGCLEKVAGGTINSYAAEVIAKAQEALPVTSGVQNVIVFVSDGNYNEWAINLNQRPDKQPDQCAQAVAAANAAKAAGTLVYSVAWGASVTDGCRFDKTYKPCATMKDIASDNTRFYSTASECQVTNSANAVGQLSAVFGAIRATLTKPRLLAVQ